MIEIKDFLKTLISLPGLSGHELPVREAIAETWRPLVDELTVSPLGSLHGLKRGCSTEPRPRILLAAHMDAIGLMVTDVVEGLLRFTDIGGVDARILPGQWVTVHARRELTGVIVQPAAHLLPGEVNHTQAVAIKYLMVDTGLLANEVAELVRPGDLISFAQTPVELSADILAGHSLDNRASVAALTACLQELRNRHHKWDVWAAATVQEEITLGGGYTSPFQIRPDIAVAIDVTFAKGPGGPSDYRTFPLGKGPTVGYGPNIHPALTKNFKETAERLDLPAQIEIMPRHSGTDAFAMQVVAEGIPTMVIGIPLRYMHTPVELVSLKDIARAGYLIAEFIVNLREDEIARLSWND